MNISPKMSLIIILLNNELPSDFIGTAKYWNMIAELSDLVDKK